MIKVNCEIWKIVISSSKQTDEAKLSTILSKLWQPNEIYIDQKWY